MTTQFRPDLDSRQNIEGFVDQFYQALLSDAILAPIFNEVAKIDLAVHLPHIKDYWCKLLLGDTRYRRHTMNIHRQLHSQRALSAQDFRQWLKIFDKTLKNGFSGPKSAQACSIAHSVAKNMEGAFCPSDD